jgi:predicted nuclease with TOPRIM domain
MEREEMNNRKFSFKGSLFVFCLLLVANGYFWNDYTSVKNKTVLLQKEKRSLLDTSEEQKTSLGEYTKNLTKLEKENSILTEEFASTTLRLQFIETEILKYETEISSVAEEMEMIRIDSPQVI